MILSPGLYDTVTRALWHCHQGFMTLSPGLYDTVTRALWHCHQGFMTLSPGLYDTVTRALWHCHQGFMTLSLGLYDTVTRALWHCHQGFMQHQQTWVTHVLVDTWMLTVKNFKMCLMTWNGLQKHMWHHWHSLLRHNWHLWFCFFAPFFTHPPIFLPVHNVQMMGGRVSA